MLVYIIYGLICIEVVMDQQGASWQESLCFVWGSCFCFGTCESLKGAVQVKIRIVKYVNSSIHPTKCLLSHEL